MNNAAYDFPLSSAVGAVASAQFVMYTLHAYNRCSYLERLTKCQIGVIFLFHNYDKVANFVIVTRDSFFILTPLCPKMG